MKISIEVNRKEYDDLPEHIKKDLFENKYYDVEEILFENELYEFLQEVKDKYDYSIDKDDLNYSFGDRGDYISLKGRAFSNLFYQALSKRCGDNADYILDVELDLRSFGVGYNDFPHVGIEGTPRRAIFVNITADCPEEIEKNILEKADELYEEIYDTFLKGYKRLSNITSEVPDIAEQELKNQYYYLNDAKGLMLILHKDDFENEQEADKFAKKELSKIYNNKKTKLTL